MITDNYKLIPFTGSIVCDSLSYSIKYRKCTVDNLDEAFLNHY